MENEMQQIHVEKVTVNVGAGEVGDGVEKGVKLIKKLTGKDPVRTQSGEGSRGFGLRPGLKIGAKVTLRGEEAAEFLERVLEAQGREVPARVFDTQGNFSIGVNEYINMPGVDYDPDIGMKGFEIAVTLERPGYRVQKRQESDDMGDDQLITPEEAQAFVADRFDCEVV